MYCCIMPSVPLNKDSIKLEELNQNDSGISPSYSGDSRGSDHSSPASSAEECGISSSTPLNLTDQKPPNHGNRTSPQPAVTLSPSQIALLRSLSFEIRSGSPTGNRDFAHKISNPPHGTSQGSPLGVLGGHCTSLISMSGGGAVNGDGGGASKEGSSSPVPFQAEKAPQVESPRLNCQDSSRSISPASSTDSNEFRGHPLQQLALVVKRNEMLVPTPPETAETNSSDKTLIHCPLCNYTTNSRSTFNAHLHAHEGQKCCYICELMTESVEELREHYQRVHDVSVSADFLHHSSGGEEEPGITVPKLNSQGKVKKHRCKQCGIVCVTKLEFWEHCRGHIKQERLLTCPKCPFVTEYKHHLEYHLRNHFGSKPFKCSKCSYSCVNKSMLNSHLKSHSNIYQFRCRDCSYATKYCHSLKLHLRKYKHSPAMVLNADGSPNPLPIVDVYGTRRGPKQKPKKPEASKRLISDENSFSNQNAFPDQMPFSNPTHYPPTQAQFQPVQQQIIRAPTQRPPTQTTFSNTPTSFTPSQSAFSPVSALSPNQTRFTPSQTLSPSQTRISPIQTSPLPMTQQFGPSTPFPSPPYSMFPSNYGLFPPFSYPLVPNNIPLSSLPLLQLDIPALLEEAKRSAETLDKLKQLFQSNTDNSQYISKALAQQIINEASRPSTSFSESQAAAPLDLSKSSNDYGYSENHSGILNSSVGSNRRKSKTVKRIAVHSMYDDDSDGEQGPPQRSPVQFRPSSLMAGAQRIY